MGHTCLCKVPLPLLSEHPDVLEKSSYGHHEKLLISRFSGITRNMLKRVQTRLDEVQQRIQQLLPDDAILVGHSLNFDLDALQVQFLPLHEPIPSRAVIVILSRLVGGWSELKISQWNNSTTSPPLVGTVPAAEKGISNNAKHLLKWVSKLLFNSASTAKGHYPIEPKQHDVCTCMYVCMWATIYAYMSYVIVKHTIWNFPRPKFVSRFDLESSVTNQCQ